MTGAVAGAAAVEAQRGQAALVMSLLALHCATSTASDANLEAPDPTAGDMDPLELAMVGFACRWLRLWF